ncbi:MAG: bacillithiol biosynthesis deacetylase BshB1 [Actinobacteria bacterium HGW-Actinobacteria-7]|jgi:bacillithiol biosynthesis deacetylase BshB1|nr:MAG: bacillithiol biosynthesis deacetylase BshB1 [Actinobacteria bacterium HGW-Actinobacteria-7]
MSEATFYDAVCVGAHPDDVEIGMGATIAGMTRAGKKVAIVDLTNGEPTPYGSPETRAKESASAAGILGASRTTLTQPNRFLFDTVEARFELAEVLREFRPRMLFMPYPSDAHPDHVAAAQIALAARFYGKLTKTEMAHQPFYVPRVFRYMAVHQRIVAEPSFVVDVSLDLQTKLTALAAYESQFLSNEKNAGIIPMMEATAHMWGSLANVEAGEPFFALEPVALSSPSDIL